MLPKKPVKYTRHARNRMRWHKISTEGVAGCLATPIFKEAAKKGKTHSWQRAGKKFLRVTWLEEENVIIVITAVLKRRPPKRWKP